MEDVLGIADRKEWYGLLVGHFSYVGGSPTVRPAGATESTWFVGPYQIETHEAANGTVSWHIATPDEALR